MTTLAEELVLLTAGIQRKSGPDTATLPARFCFGLRGAELVTLTQAGRVEIVQGRIVVRNPAPTGDPALDWLLGGLAAAAVPPSAASWVGLAQVGHVKYYFERLAAAGALRPVSYRLLLIAKVTAFELVDQATFLDVRRRLDQAVLSQGPIDAAQTALVGMVHAAGIGELCFPGSQNQAARDRLRFIADPNLRAAAAAVAQAGLAAQAGQPRQPSWNQNLDPNLLWPQNQYLMENQAPHPAGPEAAHHAAQQAAQATAEAAGHAAVQAATEAAVQAAVSASVHAAVSAATAAGDAHHHHSSMSSDSGSSHSHHSSSSGSSDSGGGGHHH